MIKKFTGKETIADWIMLQQASLLGNACTS